MKVAVLGAGSWGTVFASYLAELGLDTILYARSSDLVDRMREKRENDIYLPGIILPENLKIDSDINEVIDDAEVIFIAIPVQHIRDVISDLKLGSNVRCIVNLSKGIERGSLLFPSELIGNFFPALDYAVVSGPSFAKEVAKKKPALLVVASVRKEISIWLRDLLASERLRFYSSIDVRGVEFAGSAKNVIAMGSGILDGIGLGRNIRAALITRGLFELLKLGASIGASFETMFGLAGLGDLVLTCTSRQSRNYTFGYRLGKGESREDILSSTKEVAEGVWSAFPLLELANHFKVDTPIIREIVSILEKKSTPYDALERLMTRKLKWEWEGIKKLILREPHFSELPDENLNNL